MGRILVYPPPCIFTMLTEVDLASRGNEKGTELPKRNRAVTIEIYGCSTGVVVLTGTYFRRDLIELSFGDILFIL
jgi:hypothetical protein